VNTGVANQLEKFPEMCKILCEFDRTLLGRLQVKTTLQQYANVIIGAFEVYWLAPQRLAGAAAGTDAQRPQMVDL